MIAWACVSTAPYFTYLPSHSFIKLLVHLATYTCIHTYTRAALWGCGCLLGFLVSHILCLLACVCAWAAGIKRGPAQGKKTDMVTPSFVYSVLSLAPLLVFFFFFNSRPLSFLQLSPQWHSDGWQTAGVKVEECVTNSQASVCFCVCVKFCPGMVVYGGKQCVVWNL